LLTSGFPGVRGVDQRIADCPYPLLNKPYRRDELAQAVRDALDGVLDGGPVPASGAGAAVNALTRPPAWTLPEVHASRGPAMAERV